MTYRRVVDDIWNLQRVALALVGLVLIAISFVACGNNGPTTPSPLPSAPTVNCTFAPPQGGRIAASCQ